VLFFTVAYNSYINLDTEVIVKLDTESMFLLCQWAVWWRAQFTAALYNCPLGLKWP